jgi:hypothetical protein
MRQQWGSGGVVQRRQVVPGSHKQGSGLALLTYLTCLPACPAYQEDPKYKACMKMRNPERRLRAWTQMSQSKRVCEHTGGAQPTYRLEHGTLRIMAEFPLVKNDDEEMAVENVERKQVGR